MEFPGRPHRLSGYDYSLAGPVFHCRLAIAQRVPAFANPQTARIVVGALEHHQATTVRVFAFCVMPDHVHILLALRPGVRSLSRWVGDLKRWAKRRAVRESLELVWQKGFFERVLRSDEDLMATAKYIVANPLRAGLVDDIREYPWTGSLEWGVWGES